MKLHPTDSATTSLRSALAAIRPVRDDYQTAPVLSSFNWIECMADAGVGRWYLVVFRSVRRADADEELLVTRDDAAYAEAMAESGGLITYFRGDADVHGACISFCLWTSRDEARRASALPIHRQAVAIADATYRSFDLELHTLVRDADGTLRLEPAEA